MLLLVMLAALLLVACGGSPTDPATPVEAQRTVAHAANGEYISWFEHRIDDEGKSGGGVLRGAACCFGCGAGR